MNVMVLIQCVLFGYGFELGMVCVLVWCLVDYFVLYGYLFEVLVLNDIDVVQFGYGDVLVVVVSLFGDGELLVNGECFVVVLCQVYSLQGLCYVVFGLGDIGYLCFCGFSKVFDVLLGECNVFFLLQWVDVDVCYLVFFDCWVLVLGEVLVGNGMVVQDFCLQVMVYGQDYVFNVLIVVCECLSWFDFVVWYIILDFIGSGIVYQVGDMLYVIFDNDLVFLQVLVVWYGDFWVFFVLVDCELWLFGCVVLCEIVWLGGSELFRQLFKSSQCVVLEVYLYGYDLLDILQDYVYLDIVLLYWFVVLLLFCLFCVYFIVLVGGWVQVVLCVCEVCYIWCGCEWCGVGIGMLLQGIGLVWVYCCVNFGFCLFDDLECLLLLIGIGMGIVLLMGLVQEMVVGDWWCEICLVFGEKCCVDDFLYCVQLLVWQQVGYLMVLLIVFFCDGQVKYYVQDVIGDYVVFIVVWFDWGVYLYLCGNCWYFEVVVCGVIDGVVVVIGLLYGWEVLVVQGWLYCELY